MVVKKERGLIRACSLFMSGHMEIPVLTWQPKAGVKRK